MIELVLPEPPSLEAILRTCKRYPGGHDVVLVMGDTGRRLCLSPRWRMDPSGPALMQLREWGEASVTR